MQTLHEYLDKKKISYHQAGEKNTSRGWINISCPFCNDHSWHCGINESSGLFHCWLCGAKGDVLKIMRKVSGNTQETLSERRSLIFSDQPISDYYPNNERLNLPQFITRNPEKVNIEYLKNRRFNPDEVIEKYNLYFGGLYGLYRHCIIIPVAGMSCFVAADCTRKRFKYLNSPAEINVKNHHDILYNYDSTSDKIVLVEGIFDAWRVNGAALLTKRISEKQLKLLFGKDVIIFLDPEALKDAEKIASQIFWKAPKIVIMDKEPDELNEKEVSEFMEYVK